MTMTAQPSRVDAGVPAGGQFAKTTHSDRTVTLDDPRAARRAQYNQFAMATDARILALTEDANHAQLRNMIDDLRQAHPEAKSFELYVDDDGDIAANFVRDADGNDLEDAEADLTESLRSADPDEMQALATSTRCSLGNPRAGWPRTRPIRSRTWPGWTRPAPRSTTPGRSTPMP
jgi:hypothetical protein